MPHELVFLGQSIEPIFTESVTFPSDLYLAYFVPQDLCMLYFAHGIELIITSKVFTKLCCA